MKDCFRQSIRFTNVPPDDHPLLPWSLDEPRGIPDQTLTYRVGPRASVFPLAKCVCLSGSQFPIRETGEGCPAHKESVRMDPDNVANRPVVGAWKWDNETKKKERGKEKGKVTLGGGSAQRLQTRLPLRVVVS